MRTLAFLLPSFLLVFACGKGAKPPQEVSRPTRTTAVESKPAASRPMPAKLPNQAAATPDWRERFFQPATPSMGADGCPQGSRATKSDELSTDCQVENEPGVTLVVLGTNSTQSTEVNLLLFESHQDTSYGYQDGYITSKKVCKRPTREACTETAFGEKGVRLSETSIQSGSGVHMTTYYANGMTSSEGPLRSEGKFGSWTFYDSEGNETHKEVHADGGALTEP